MTTHRGSITQTGATLDEAIHKAHIEIAVYVGARTYEMRTESRPVLMFSDRPLFWQVDVTWWVIDPADNGTKAAQ